MKTKVLNSKENLKNYDRLGSFFTTDKEINYKKNK